MSCLSSYFPVGLDKLIHLATLIKPKVIRGVRVTYILTAKGQIFGKYNDGDYFTLWHKEPVQDIFVDPLYHDVVSITLDAKVLYKDRFKGDNRSELGVVDVISVASYGSTTAISITGGFYRYDSNQSKFIPERLPGPVVAQGGQDGFNPILLRTNGRVWRYEQGHEVKDITSFAPDRRSSASASEMLRIEGSKLVGAADDVEDVVALSDRGLLRSDGKIYELFSNDELRNNYKLNKDISDIVAIDSSNDENTLSINLIYRSGRVIRKLLTDINFEGYLDNRKYKIVMLPIKAVAVGGNPTTIILADGRVVQGENVMVTIPRLNVFCYYTSFATSASKVPRIERSEPILLL